MSRNKKNRGNQKTHPNPNQNSGDHHTSNNIHVRGEIEIARSPGLADEHAAELHKDDTQTDKKYRLEQITLGALIVYTAITLILAVLNVIAITDSREHFTKDQRPYVWITDDLGPFTQAPEGSGDTSGKLGFNFHFKNYGKSPAIHCQSKGRILFGENAEKAISFDTWHIDPSQGTILPTGKEAFNTAWSDDPIHDPELLKRIATAGIVENVLVSGYIYYSDTSGNTYSSEFCVGRNPALTFFNCKTHNQIK